jgi:diguanylate cyclase (GGDEF)-like protein
MSIDKPPSSRIEQTRAVDAGPRSVRRYGVLTVTSGLETGRVLSIPANAVTKLGRAPECTYSFDDGSLSREHATVFRAGGDYILKDTSTNGTFVNDERITTAVVLRDGDRIQLGSNTLLRFALVDEEEEASLRRVYEAAILDGLTGIHNRKHLEERLAAELALALRSGDPLSVIIFDVDHFKKVNDTHGHLAGDAVLKGVASRIARLLRPDDFVARYGGEEMVVVARATDLEAATAMAERLRLAVAAEPIRFEARDIAVTASAGVASLACCGEQRDRATLLGTADRRLYAAKQAGRNRVVGCG